MQSDRQIQLPPKESDQMLFDSYGFAALFMSSRYAESD